MQKAAIVVRFSVAAGLLFAGYPWVARSSHVDLEHPDMQAEPSLIMIQFLQWVAARPRSREDVMEAWRSSCPRFPVWEDARAEGLIRQAGGERGEHRVELTRRGETALRRAEKQDRQTTAQRLPL